jgi:hypothetical protein
MRLLDLSHFPCIAFTAVFGMWGAFWLGYGILDRPGATPTAILTAVSPEVAFGFIVLAAITWITALAAASTLGAIAEGIGIHGLWVLSGWLFAIAGVVAWCIRGMDAARAA